MAFEKKELMCLRMATCTRRLHSAHESHNLLWLAWLTSMTGVTRTAQSRHTLAESYTCTQKTVTSMTILDYRTHPPCTRQWHACDVALRRNTRWHTVVGLCSHATFAGTRSSDCAVTPRQFHTRRLAVDHICGLHTGCNGAIHARKHARRRRGHRG